MGYSVIRSNPTTVCKGMVYTKNPRYDAEEIVHSRMKSCTGVPVYRVDIKTKSKKVVEVEDAVLSVICKLIFFALFAKDGSATHSQQQTDHKRMVAMSPNS
jgi:hypothetical protein